MVGRVPNLKMNEIVKSKALVRNPDVQATLAARTAPVTPGLQCAACWTARP